LFGPEYSSQVGPKYFQGGQQPPTSRAYGHVLMDCPEAKRT